MKLVFLDAATMGEDLSLQAFAQFGTLEIYSHTAPQELLPRVAHADIILVNKVKIRQELIDQLPHLKMICEAATGMDNIDVAYARSKGIVVRNVAGYSTASVAQTAFMLLLSLVGHVGYFNEFVHSGAYAASGMATHYGGRYYHELAGKRMGIIGLGTIGKKVAQLATAFDMEVVYYSSHGADRCEGLYPRLELEELLATSDVVSIHSPLNEQTKGLIGAAQLRQMKPTAYLLNLGRGAIVDEAALAEALNNNQIAGAGIDVYSTEPIPATHPYYTIKEKEKVVFTPHIGWASKEARERLVAQMVSHIQHFLATGS